MVEKHFSDADRTKLMERKDDYFQPDVSREWDALIAEGNALVARDADPGSPEAADLARRWMVQVNRFTGGDAAINAKSSAMYKDAFSDPDTAGKMPFSAELWRFVGEAYRRAQAG